MGMYDTVIIDGLKLKTSKEVTSFLKANNTQVPTEFQTKDLENFLGTYKINSKGDIFREERKPTGKKIPYELPFANWKDNRSWLEKVYWNFKHKEHIKEESIKLINETKPVFVKVKLTNTFTMLAIEDINGRRLMLDYEVKIIDGKVKSTKLLEWSIESEEDTLKRQQDDMEFKKNMELSFAARRSFQSKWYYPVLKETVNPAVFFARILVQKACNKIVTWSYRWHGV
jgi:hypothetical protein